MTGRGRPAAGRVDGGDGLVHLHAHQYGAHREGSDNSPRNGADRSLLQRKMETLIGKVTNSWSRSSSSSWESTVPADAVDLHAHVRNVRKDALKRRNRSIADPSLAARFTLTELMVVMTVVGIMAAMSVPVFSGRSTNRGRRGRRESPHHLGRSATVLAREPHVCDGFDNA